MSVPHPTWRASHASLGSTLASRLTRAGLRTIAVGACVAAVACGSSGDRVIAPGVSPRLAVENPGGPNLLITEVMADPAVTPDAAGEYIKLYNPGPTDVDLQNFQIISATGTNVYTGGTNAERHTIASSVVIPAGTCVVLGNNVDPSANGGITTEKYSYGTSITLGNNNTDWVEIKTPSGVLLDSVAYSASTVSGTTRTITSPSYTATTATARILKDPSVPHPVLGDTAVWRNATTDEYYGGTTNNRGTPNSCQYTYRIGGGSGGPVASVSVAPTTATVIVGSTVAFTATARDSTGAATAATFTWTSADTTVARVNASGVVTGVSPSSAPVTITATATNGVSGSATVTVAAAGAIASITWSGTPTATSSMAAGFQTQLFTPVARDGNGTTVPATFTFEAVDPAVATISPVGSSAIITGVSGSSTNPRFRVTATPTAGGPAFSTITSPVTIETAVYADSASTFADNAEFGRPTAASTSNLNDLLIARTTYTLSYNASRGTPNWVSYELDQRQRSTGQDRCNCFTAEPTLPASRQIFTTDYTNGGYDRGHMARSADRTVTNGENARTFYLSNVVPQTADLNQGVWATFENQLGDSAAAGRAVYIITGPIYSPNLPARYLKQDSGQTKVRIPDSTWKVAFIGPYAAGNPFHRGDIRSWDDLANTTVLAVNMPNIAGVRNDAPSKYYTTVDAIEASTGYDFLSLLPTAYQAAIEAGDHPPVPVLNGPTSGSEGQTLAFNAAGTVDPDVGDMLTYAWDFGDGTTATGASTTKAYTDNGTYTVVLTVTDRYGYAITRRRTVTVTNVAPTTLIGATSTTVAVGQAFNPLARFTDPGTNDGTWRASIAWGDGTTLNASLATLPTGAIRASHAYATAGTYTLRFTVTDKDGASAFIERTVTVTP